MQWESSCIFEGGRKDDKRRAPFGLVSLLYEIPFNLVFTVLAVSPYKTLFLSDPHIILVAVIFLCLSSDSTGADTSIQQIQHSMFPSFPSLRTFASPHHLPNANVNVELFFHFFPFSAAVICKFLRIDHFSLSLEKPEVIVTKTPELTRLDLQLFL